MTCKVLNPIKLIGMNIRGFYFRDVTGDYYYEKGKRLPCYSWVWRDGHGTGVYLQMVV